MGPKGLKGKKNIWYQVDGREVSNVELPAGGQYIQLCRAIKEEENLEVPASTLTLKAKKVDETGYTTLNVDFFHDECDNDFNKLISKFKIKRTNPIKVKYLATASENEEIKKLKEELDALKISQETIRSPVVDRSTHASSNEIHVRYENQSFSFNKNVLEAMRISNIDDLTGVIKLQLKKSIKDVSDKVITLRRGENDFMDPETSISGLCNTEDQALHVIVANVPTINLTVKTSKKDFYFSNQHIGSTHDEIIKFIKSREVLTQFITDNTIFLGDDGQALSSQHLVSAQESGTFNITLTDPYIDTVSHKEILEEAFNCQFRS
ncbi:hypothetical protein RclHR1_14590003 [Rhizophagus clarus]|uniref:Uncharacterized protein n=1 Tax=Rhizophagus clarus TaxID=94130 RepID=A0A2Z6QTN3_9GLOM|nr:hypothetical protein RclHR1_14590003 [Rhizophagus clarus]GES76177.1 hypothetical protein GLOIN_2v1781572 [Rhizophagus clarus]